MTFLCVHVCLLLNIVIQAFFIDSEHCCEGTVRDVPLSLVSGELSPCRVLNGGCGDLCLLTPDGTVNCSCRGERILLDDNRCVCKFPHASLRLSERYEITLLHLFQQLVIAMAVAQKFAI